MMRVVECVLRVHSAPLIFALVALLAPWPGRCGSGMPEPLVQPMHDMIMETIRLVYEEDFSAAIVSSRRIVKQYSDHPAGYFFCASVLDAHMAHEMSPRFENEFFRYCNEAVAKGEQRLLKNKGDTWSQFFVGGAEGLKGNYESRYQRWITAFRYGWKGVSILKRIQADYPQMADLRYGIGTYRYWRSAMTDVMKWMPGVKDERAEGLEDLCVSMKAGLYTSVASGQNLLDMYFNEKRYGDMLVVADSLLHKFPGNYAFLQGRAKALHGQGNHAAARTILEGLKPKADAITVSNFNSLVVRCWLIRALKAQGKVAEAQSVRAEMRQYSLPPELLKLVQPDLTAIDQLLK